MACVGFVDLGSFVRQIKGQRAWKQAISTIATSSWLEAASPTALGEALQAGVKIYSASIGPDEMLWMPTGFMKVERIGPELSVGLRRSVLYTEDEQFVAAAAAVKADLLNMSKVNAALNLATEIKAKLDHAAKQAAKKAVQKDAGMAPHGPQPSQPRQAAPAAAEAKHQQLQKQK